MSIELTRGLLTAALDGSLSMAGFTPHPVFKVLVPDGCDCAAESDLDPRATWADKDAYDAAARKLAGMFAANFEQYRDTVTAEVLAAGPDPDAAA